MVTYGHLQTYQILYIVNNIKHKTDFYYKKKKKEDSFIK